jgi:hypothetical protein
MHLIMPNASGTNAYQPDKVFQTPPAVGWFVYFKMIHAAILTQQKALDTKISTYRTLAVDALELVLKRR